MSRRQFLQRTAASGAAAARRPAAQVPASHSEVDYAGRTVPVTP